MHRCELSLKITILSLFLAACSGRTPTVVLSPQPLPTLGTFTIRIDPPISIGELTSIRVSGDLSFELTFPAGTNITNLPELITIAGAQFQRQPSTTLPGFIVVVYGAVNPNQPLETTQLVTFSLAGNTIAFSLEVLFSGVLPTPIPTTAPEPTPTPTSAPNPDVVPSAPIAPGPLLSPSPSPVPSAAPSSGAGFTPAANSTINIGSVAVGQAGTATLSISETGTAALSISSALSGTNASAFSLSPTSITIADGGAAQVLTIRCTPLTLGILTATLELTTNDPNQPTVGYLLSCEGVVPTPALIVNTLVDEAGTEANTALKCSLREAIIANNTDASFGGCGNPKGTITFDPILNSNTIVLTAAPEPITKDVVVRGPGAGSLTISGNNAQRVFKISATNNPVVTVEKLTLTQGLAPNASGGAIFSASTGLLTIDSVTISNSTATGSSSQGGGTFAGTVTVSDSTLTGNSARSGGGISATTATVSNSSLSGNSAGDDGGGILAIITATVSNSTLSGNSANSGGGIYARVTVTVSDSTLTGNSANYSGGGILASVTATVSNSTLSSNSARSGGGIFATTATVSDSPLTGNSANSGNGGGIRALTATVSDSPLSGNSAGDDGGGIFARTATVSNSTLSGNSAGDDGGGILASVTATVSNSTIVLNRSSTGGGIFRAGTGTFVVNNTIVAGNTTVAGTTAHDISGTLTGGFNNLIGAGGAGGLTHNTKGNIVDNSLTFANLSSVLETTLNANNTLINAGTSQQPVLTHKLVTGSQAIDKGDNDKIPIRVNTDQRGLTRIINGTVDIGAFEVQ